MANCMICGKEIDINDNSIPIFRCKKCAKMSGVMIECVWCNHLNLFRNPPCSLDVIIVEGGKCKFYDPPLSMDDITKFVKQFPYLFYLVN
ncbi:MAG: hypothetical protein ACTSRG_18035 [Candidatus Helarchaeota archaeon]